MNKFWNTLLCALFCLTANIFYQFCFEQHYGIAAERSWMQAVAIFFYVYYWNK